MLESSETDVLEIPNIQLDNTVHIVTGVRIIMKPIFPAKLITVKLGDLAIHACFNGMLHSICVCVLMFIFTSIFSL